MRIEKEVISEVKIIIPISFISDGTPKYVEAVTNTYVLKALINTNADPESRFDCEQLTAMLC